MCPFVHIRLLPTVNIVNKYKEVEKSVLIVKKKYILAKHSIINYTYSTY